MPLGNISMTPEEIRMFLSTQTRAILGTVDTAGMPWGDIVRCRYAADKLFFLAILGGRSAQNIKMDNRIFCAVDQLPTYYRIKGVTVHGRAEPCFDAALFSDILHAGARRSAFSVDLNDAFGLDFLKITRRF